jgi:hypothetical protein
MQVNVGSTDRWLRVLVGLVTSNSDDFGQNWSMGLVRFNANCDGCFAFLSWVLKY